MKRGFEEALQLVKGDIPMRPAVVEVAMNGSGNNHKFLISYCHALPMRICARHFFKSIFGEITAVRLFAMNEKDGSLDFVCVGELGHIHKSKLRGQIAAVEELRERGW